MPKTKTDVVKLNDKKTLSRAVNILSDGGIIIYPTETIYGIGADATNDMVVKKVMQIKKRTKSKHILIAFSDLKMAKKYLVITKNAEKLAEAFMPGPLSLIVETKSRPTRRVGFRIPDNKFVLSLIRKLGKPITSTSANISGTDNLYKIKDIIKIFDGKVAMIIDAGSIPKRKASTLYDTIEGKIVREGPISEKKIRDVLKG
ncbi:MAG: L-threonylcarbamoyladenylate synthase [Candidatus Aenigmatarchaeota archaeon]